MNLQDWIPAASTTGLFAAALWLARSLVAERLRASIKSEFEQELEDLRSDLRVKEEVFKAELRMSEVNITQLQSGALSGLVSRQLARDERRIKAIEEVWSAVIQLQGAKALVATVSALKFEPAVTAAASNPEMQEMFKGLTGGFVPDILNTSAASKARPFISAIAWAYFEAYTAIIGVAVLKMKMLENGLDQPDLIKEDRLKSLVAAALPFYVKYFEEYKEGAYPHLLEQLEEKLLIEMQAMLDGAETDQETLKQAANIMKEAKGLAESA